jgi:hypothetical protein
MTQLISTANLAKSLKTDLNMSAKVAVRFAKALIAESNGENETAAKFLDEAIAAESEVV